MTVFNLAIELAYWQQTVIRSVLALVAVLLPAGTLAVSYTHLTLPPIYSV